MSRHLGLGNPLVSPILLLFPIKHFEFSSPDPPNFPLGLGLGFLHVLPVGAWCCVSPSALYTHDSQKMRITKLMDSSSGQPVNICSLDKMPGLQSQLWGGLGLIDSYYFACCLFFFNLHLCVWACVSGCMPVVARRKNQWSRVRVPGIREPSQSANMCGESRTQDLQKSSKSWIIAPDGFMFSC